MIKAIFFSRFDPEKGPVVLHQVPDGSIVPTSSATTRAPLLDFASISDYIIPRQEFCGRLVSICANRYRIIGYPVCVVNPSKYDRNEYIFNFSLVLDDDVDMTGYQDVVRMLAALFENLEVQESLLSSEKLVDADKNVLSGDELIGGRVYAICEMVLEDLNNYCEFMMPIDDRNTLNMKLFPSYSPPISVKPWHVPLSTARLTSLLDTSWDIAVARIAGYINGVDSVATIARLAESDISQTCNVIAHLQYYGCILLLDLFQFSAIYAPTATIGTIVTDLVLQKECGRYVSTVSDAVECNTILELYASMGHAMTLKVWCTERKAKLRDIDVRRFVTFGVIKGFLYRVHKFALDIAPASHGRRETWLSHQHSDVENESVVGPIPQNHPLKKYLDGMHCFDQICTEQSMSEQSVMEELKRFTDIQILYR